MKIHRLEIKNVRGIRQLIIKPEGNSFVIYGSNGSGKSAVIDALDFLLKGNIDRLEGKGTDGISLKDHGPHINMTAEPEKVLVTADISINGSNDIITISRNLKDKELKYDEKYKDQIEPLMGQLSRGQHVFTRREILRLITSPSKDRSDEILRILKLDYVEQTRKSAVSVNGDAKKSFKENEAILNSSKNAVLEIVSIEKYEEVELLKFVNELRKTLKLNSLEKLKAVDIKPDVEDDKQKGISIDHEDLDQRTSNLLNSISVVGETELAKTVDNFESTLNIIQVDEESAWNSKRNELTKMGVSLLRDSGECPLCDTEWDEGILGKNLTKRLSEQGVREEELNNCKKTISDIAEGTIRLVKNISDLILPLTQNDKFKNDEVIIQSFRTIKEWKEKIKTFLEDIKNPIRDYKNYNTTEVKSLFIDKETNDAIKIFSITLKKLFPEATPEQAAIAKLIRLEERIAVVETAQESFQSASSYLSNAKEFEAIYTKAKDEVLNQLYSEVKDNFVELYKEMHSPDEVDFEAELIPLKAGLKFNVDFYGKGYHPPHAMHSEGHQDSMGVCLYLALSERLNKGVIDLSILDDVVMSVDSDHRKAFCRVLNRYFPHKQFIITTHDTTWAFQLQKMRVVSNKHMLRLYGWTVDAGPLSNYTADVWEKIDLDLIGDNVNDAAAKLRRGLEEWSRMICGNLRASVPYIPNDGGSLEGFMSSAIAKYKSLLKKTKNVAISWGKTELVEQYEEQLSVFDQIRERTEIEKWVINPAVHYNAWESFTKKEFQSVVNAFKDLTNLFNCTNPDCGTAISVEYKGMDPSSVTCRCGEINWNLTTKQ